MDDPKLFLNQALDVIIRLALSAALGFFAWHGKPWLFLLSPLVFVLWAGARSRIERFVVPFLYYSFATWPALFGSVTYLDGFGGVGLWLLCNGLLSMPFALVNNREVGGRLWMPILFIVLSLLPPLAAINWANPVSAAGWLFPGLGLTGFWIMAALLVFTPVYPRLATMFWFTAAFVVAFAVLPPNESTYQTHYHYPAGIKRDLTADHERQARLFDQVRADKRGVVVLHEAAMGELTPVMKARWREFLAANPGKTVIGSGVDPKTGDTVLTAYEHGRLVELYRQQIPMPGVGHTGILRGLFDTGRGANRPFPIMMDGKTVEAKGVICWEQLLVVPWLDRSKVKVVVAPANLWWANSHYGQLQANIARGWARLFNQKILLAFNLPDGSHV